MRKFVYVTGMFDYLVGAATWAGALYDPQPQQFVALMTLGTFLMMAAALLVWASKDLVARAPVVFWQGLVRLTAASSIVYAVPAGLSQPWEYSLVVFDGVIALTYLIGMPRVTGRSVFELLACKTA